MAELPKSVRIREVGPRDGFQNVLAALEQGRLFESSFGELGGCPVPAGSTGDVGSEDVVSMLHEMGSRPGSTCHG